MARISGKLDADGRLARIGEAVRSERQRLGISQEALADEAGLDRLHLGRIERGERNVTLLNLTKIADALRCKLSELLSAADL